MPTALLVFEFIGTGELMIIAVVALIIFGPRKLPDLGRSLGRSLAEFKRASEDFKRTWEYEVELEQRSTGGTQTAVGAAEGASGGLAAGEPDASGGPIPRGSAWHEDAPADADTPAPGDDNAAAPTPGAQRLAGEDPAANPSGAAETNEPNEPPRPRES